MSINMWVKKVDDFFYRFILPIGLIVQLTGIFWVGDRGVWVSQTYTWLVFPALVCLLCRIKTIAAWRPSATDLFFAGFICLALISRGWSDAHLSWESVIKRCVYITLYIYALVCLSRDADKLKKIIVFSCVVAVVAAFLSIFYHYIIQGEGVGVREYRIYSFIPGVMADLEYPVEAGLYYAVFAVLLFSWQSCQKKMNPWLLIWVVLGLAILGFYILETWSRGAWIATLAGCSVAVLFGLNRRTWIILSLVSLFCVLMITLNYKIFQSEIVDMTFSGRTDLWIAAIKKIAQQPWFGYGFRSSFVAENNTGHILHDPHSYYLQLLRMYGIIGTLLFVGLLVSLASLIVKYRGEILVRMATSVLVMGLTAMVTDIGHIITRPGYAWGYVWLPVGMILGTHYRLKYSLGQADKLKM